MTHRLSLGAQLLIWYGARLAGWVHQWVRSGWRPWLGWVIVADVAIAGWRALTGHEWDDWRTTSWLVTVAVVAVIGRAMAVARSRIVVEPFDDLTVAAPDHGHRGVSTLLMAELGRLARLYNETADQSAGVGEGALQAVDSTVKVDDVGEFLRGPVSSEATAQVGPMAVPIGLVVGALGRIARGPRLVGGMHRVDGRLVLVAQLHGSAGSASFRCEGADVPAEEDRTRGDTTADGLQDAVVVLACQVFTERVMRGRVDWRAVWHFNSGLAAFREATRHAQQRQLNLRRAEHAFARARAADQRLVAAYYNLGLVYLEQQPDPQITDPATGPLLEAIKREPSGWGAYNALSTRRFQRRDFDAVRRLNLRLLRHAHDRAARAVAHDWLGRVERTQGRTSSAVSCRARAVNSGWWSLMHAELLRGDSRRARSVLQRRRAQMTYLLNLAVGLGYLGLERQHLRGENDRRAKARFRAARTALSCLRIVGTSHPDLAESLTNARFEAGKILAAAQDHRRAAHELRRATERDPLLPEAALHLVRVARSQGQDQADVETLRQRAALALARATSLREDALRSNVGDDDEQTLQLLGDALAIRRLLEAVRSSDRNDADLQARLRDQLEGLGRLTEHDEDGRWQSWLDLLRGELEPDVDVAAPVVARALELLPGEEVRLHALRNRFARRLFEEDRLVDALRQVEEALALRPTSDEEHRLLGDIWYRGLDDPEAARSAYEAAALWSDDQTARNHVATAFCNFGLAERTVDRRVRREARWRTEEHLRQALELYPVHDLVGRGWASCWLGLHHFRTHQYGGAVQPLASARRMMTVVGHETESLSAALFLGGAQLRSGMYAAGSATLSSVRAMVSPSSPGDADLPEHMTLLIPEWPWSGQRCELAAYAYLWQAQAAAHRDVGLMHSLEDVAVSLAWAERIQDDETREDLRAECHLTRAYIECKRSPTVRHLATLTDAARDCPEAFAHLWLAEAYLLRLEEERVGSSETRRLRRLVGAHLRHAADIDFDDGLVEEIAVLRAHAGTLPDVEDSATETAETMFLPHAR